MYKKRWWAFFFSMPFLLFTVAVLIPAGIGFYTAFTDWKNIGSPLEGEWVGTDNFSRLWDFGDGSFAKSITFTISLAALLVVIVNVLGFAMAYLTTRPMKGTNFFRGAYFIPNMMGGIIVGYIWQFIFSNVLPAMNLGDDWLTGSKAKGVLSLAILVAWQQAGYIMVIYIAAIQNIPRDISEASYIDGASPLKKAIRVYAPYIFPAFTVTTFLMIRFSFGLFDQVFALAGGGGPNNPLQTISLDIYYTAFYRGSVYADLAQAKGLIYFLIVSSIAMTQVWLTKKGEANG